MADDEEVSQSQVNPTGEHPPEESPEEPPLEVLTAGEAAQEEVLPIELPQDEHSPVETEGRRSSQQSHTMSIRDSLTIKKEEVKQFVSGLNANVLGVTILMVFGMSFQSGYTGPIMNQPALFIMDFMRECMASRGNFVNDIEMKSYFALATGIFIIGGILGAVISGFTVDPIGVKGTLHIGNVFAILGAILPFISVYAKNEAPIYIGRFLMGITCGIANCVVPMFLTEIVPNDLRGGITTCHQLVMTFGIFLVSILGFPQILGNAIHWNVLFILQVIPAVIMSIILPFIPESPRYLLFNRKKEDAALASLSYYRRTTPDHVKTEMNTMLDEFNERQKLESQAKAFNYPDLFKARDLRKPLLLACGVQLVQQFSGINAVIYYAAFIFMAANVHKEAVPYAVSGRISQIVYSLLKYLMSTNLL